LNPGGVDEWRASDEAGKRDGAKGGDNRDENAGDIETKTQETTTTNSGQVY
jgi:hypothetical protein